MLLKKKIKADLFNPLLFAILVVMACLYLTHADFDRYYDSSQVLPYLLTPATICLAVPLYRQMELLKKHCVAILVGISAGVLSNALSILLLSLFFGLKRGEYVTLLPKSVTIAIGLGISEELGGVGAITVAAIIFTGLFGNIAGPKLCEWFGVREPIAVGLAMGTSSHAIGTAKALELGEVEGAMSALAIVLTGLLTVAGAPFFVALMK